MHKENVTSAAVKTKEQFNQVCILGCSHLLMFGQLLSVCREISSRVQVSLAKQKHVGSAPLMFDCTDFKFP